jgi:hypothetical protein
MINFTPHSSGNAMRKSDLFSYILFVFFFMLTACASNNGYDQTQVHENLLNETWMHQMDINPSNWTRNADPWFFTGNPNSIQQYDNTAPAYKAITTSMVRVPDFTDVTVSGDFQVQIYGRAEHNSVFIIGPNASTRQIAVEVINNTLYIHKLKDSKVCLKNVIVRINVRNLHVLKNLGASNIYGRDITSSQLFISSCDCGNIFLCGNMNLARVSQTGTGTVVVLGANTPCLDIKVIGSGCVKVNGHVGIQNIYHNGNGDVTILDADTDALTINANGYGTTSVVGCVNLKKVRASGCSRVYVYWVSSSGFYATADGTSRIGLAGTTANMDVDITNASLFEGRYLRGDAVYVRTRDTSHANVASDKKIFAAALDRSSIYIFGSPTMVSRYTSQRGAIIPVWMDTSPTPFPPTLAYRQHRSYKGE